jgi:hypothetical protein
VHHDYEQQEKDSAMATWDTRFKLRQMSMSQLQQLAREHALRGFSKLRKPQLAAALEEKLGLSQAGGAGVASSGISIASSVAPHPTHASSTALHAGPGPAARPPAAKLPAEASTAYKPSRGRRQQQKSIAPVQLSA